jgi:hypothetical protein
VSIEPPAAPFHDWNGRITAESYRPNGWVCSTSEAGSRRSSTTGTSASGPTLLSARRPTLAMSTTACSLPTKSEGAIKKQAYNHAILPLCDERDARTQIRWGLADFTASADRRPGCGCQTAANDDVLALLVEEGALHHPRPG